MKRNNAQMEVLGLAVLFVIVIVAFLLFLRMQDDAPDTPFEDYYQRTLAHDMLMTVVAISFDCDGAIYSVGDIAKDSKDMGNIRCIESSRSTVLGKTSSEILKEVGAKIVGHNMDKIGRKYWFAIWTNEELNDAGLPDFEAMNSANVYINQSKNVDDEETCNMFDPQEEMAQVTYSIRNGKIVYLGLGVCK